MANLEPPAERSARPVERRRVVTRRVDDRSRPADTAGRGGRGTDGIARRELDAVLAGEDIEDRLRLAYRDGFFHRRVPEVPALAMQQDPIHRHKDVLAHTFAVTARIPDRPRLRLAALFHDIAKPGTRRICSGKVTFRHHEVVGARMTRDRMTELGYADDEIADISRLVELSGRFHGFRDGWTDAAVRRYARDAGPLLADLLLLARHDCTTRHPHKVRRLHDDLNDLERRICALARADASRRQRPPLAGEQVMALLGIGPGPTVGAAQAMLAEHRDRFGSLDPDQAAVALMRWWEQRCRTLDSESSLRGD